MAKATSLDVVFRVFPEGDVIALFPSEKERDLIMSYQPLGQHSLASPALVRELRAATPSEYAKLLAELRSLGYRLHVKRGPGDHSTRQQTSTQHSAPISDDAKIREAIKRFPSTFGLRSFPGRVFRLSPTSSYVSDGRVVLYTQRKEGDHWLDFSKGSESELRDEIEARPSAVGARETRSLSHSACKRPDRSLHHSARSPEKSYRVSALVGAGVANPVNLGTVPRKSAAMKIARDFMKATKPKTAYDSVQILPLIRDQRDWNTESIRWLGVTTNVRRPTWVRGQGVK